MIVQLRVFMETFPLKRFQNNVNMCIRRCAGDVELLYRTAGGRPVHNKPAYMNRTRISDFYWILIRKQQIRYKSTCMLCKYGLAVLFFSHLISDFSS